MAFTDNRYFHEIRFCKKIIATTNPELWYKGKFNEALQRRTFADVARISETFITHYIEQYNLGSIITEINVEYWCNKCEGTEKIHNGFFNIDCDNCYYKNHNPILVPRLDKDGCIIIAASKQLFTREEFKEACRISYFYGRGLEVGECDNTNKLFEIWFDKNY